MTFSRQLGRTSAGFEERHRAPPPKTPLIESAKGSASVYRGTSRRSAASASIATEPEVCGDSFEQGGPQVNVRYICSVLYLEFGRMTIPECDVRRMVGDLAIIRGYVRKLIRIRELAASYKQEQIRRVRKLEM